MALSQVSPTWHQMLIQHLLDGILNMGDVGRCMMHVVMRLYAAIKVRRDAQQLAFL